MTGARCGAKCRDGGTCTQRPMLGQTRCRLHGAKAPNSLRAGRRRLAEQQAVKAVKRAGVDVEAVADPVALLRELAAEAVALKEFFAERLAALEELRYRSGSGEQLRSEVALYERSLERAQKFAADLARLGISERSVRVDEARVILLVAVLERVLASPTLALDLGRQAEARTLLIEELRADA